MSGVRYSVVRYLLSATERVTSAGTQDRADTTVIDNPNALRLALLVCNNVAETIGRNGVHRDVRQPDAMAGRQVKESCCLDTRFVIKNTLDPDLKSAALIHLRMVVDGRKVLNCYGFMERDLIILQIDNVRPITLFGLCCVGCVKTRFRINVELETQPRRDRCVLACSQKL